MATVAELVAELLTVEAHAAAIEERRKELRAELAERAQRQHAEEGALPRWQVAGAGSVSWCERKGALAVIDGPAFRSWVRDRYGDDGFAVEVAGHVTNELAKTCAVSPADELITIDGELVAGVRMGPPSHYLSVRLDREAKARAAAAAYTPPEVVALDDPEPVDSDRW